MTLKYGFLGLPQGGAKAGVLGIPPARVPRDGFSGRAPSRTPPRTLLRDARYVPDADMGTEAADIRWMIEALDQRVGPHDWQNNRSGLHTATSSLPPSGPHWHIAASLRRMSCGNRRLRPCGSDAGRAWLHDEGARPVVAAIFRRPRERSTIPRSRRPRTAHVDGGRNPCEHLRRRDAPARGPARTSSGPLCPCARGGSIHEGNAAAITARFVCAGANNPLTPGAEQILSARGILVPPDFISNSGGVLGGTLEYAGVSPARAARLIRRAIEPAVRRLLEDADAAGVAPGHWLSQRRSRDTRESGRRPSGRLSAGTSCTSDWTGIAAGGCPERWLARSPRRTRSKAAGVTLQDALRTRRSIRRYEGHGSRTTCSIRCSIWLVAPHRPWTGSRAASWSCEIPASRHGSLP